MGERSRERAAKLAAEPEEAQPRTVALESAVTGLDPAQLADTLLDGFSLLSPQGVHLEVNPALCAMTGFTRDELIGAGPPHPYWPPEDAAAIQDALAKTVSGAGQTRALTFRRKHGERFPVLVTLSILRDDQGEISAVYALVKDMTALREAEAALAESEQLFRLTFDQSPIGAALAGLDLRFRRVNARFARMTGYSTEELLKRGFSDITHPDDIASDLAQVERLAAGDIDEYARQKRYVRKDGSVAWGEIVVRPVLSAAGETMAFVALVNDITARRRAEEDLREARRLLDEAQAMSRLGGWEYDVAAQRLSWTDEVYHIYGVGTGDGPISVDRAAEFYAPESARLLVEAFRQALAAGVPYDLELELERADGQPIWVRTIGRPIVENGAVVRVTGSIMDVTGRKTTDRLLSVPSEVLEILATPVPVPQIVESIVAALKRATGLDGVGLRLRDEDDYPFAAAVGYSDDFLRAENTVALRFPDGGLCRDEDGSLSLECTCGLVLSGGADPTNSLFTPGGSALTNDATSLLDTPPEQDPRMNPRNRCIQVGFQSIALVPLRAGEEIIGLLHLADRRKDRFTVESVRFLEGVGGSIGVALQHRRAEDRIHRQNEELLRLNEELAARAAALEEANATISRIAATDDLTGLANRRHFYESLEKAVSLARRHGGPLALVSLDLDGLKEVNDSAGHAAGDAVLRNFAALLGGLCRTEDLAARLGGDEFGLLLPDIDVGGARRLAERMLEAVRTCEALMRHDVTASAGVAQWDPEERPDDLLRRADEALYAAKRGGGDTVADAG